MSVQGSRLPSGNILNVLLIGGVVVVAIIALSSLLKSASGLSLFGGGTGDKGGQTSDSSSELGRLQAEFDRAISEANRLESEASRAETEGRRGDAEQLRADAELIRAEAEKLRAENDKLAIELAGKAETLDVDVTIGGESEDSQKEKAGKEAGDEAGKIPESEETDSGQTVTDEAPDTMVKGTEPDTEITVGRDEIEEAIDKATNAKTRGQQRFRKESFFASGSESQIIVETDPRTGARITGGGTAGQPARFTIFETKPVTLSDVLRQNPEFTASQARDFLSKQGTFQTPEEQKAFEEFDFGTNLGRGIKASSTIVRGATTEEAKETEALKAEETLRRIQAGETVVAPKPKRPKRRF